MLTQNFYFSDSRPSSPEGEHQPINGIKSDLKIPKKVKTKPKIHQNYTYPTSFWKQFSALIIRNFRKITRDIVSLKSIRFSFVSDLY